MDNSRIVTLWFGFKIACECWTFAARAHSLRVRLGLLALIMEDNRLNIREYF